MHYSYQQAIIKLQIDLSFTIFILFGLVYIGCNSCKNVEIFTGFFLHVPDLTFQIAGNFNTINVNLQVIGGFFNSFFSY